MAISYSRGRGVVGEVEGGGEGKEGLQTKVYHTCLTRVARWKRRCLQRTETGD